MKAYGIATGSSTDDGGFNYAENSQLLAKDYLDSLKPGQLVRIEVVQQFPRKTKKQLGNIFGNMLEGVIAQSNDQGIDVSSLLAYLSDKGMPKGVGLTKDFLLELAYMVCPTVDKDGRRITLSKMDTQQANNFFERFRLILGPLGIDIHDPNPDFNK